MPLFHNFYFKPLIAFRYFFWMKTLVQHPDFQQRKFEFNCVSDQVELLSRQLVISYNKIPSSEIWNTELINAVILQIEFYKDSGYFSSAGDIKIIYETLEETFLHMRNEAENGCKFMPGETPENRKSNFNVFYNRVILGDNTIMVVTDRINTVVITYNALNYMTTRDEAFCNPCYNDIQNTIKKSTLISQTGERQRNIFFNIMFNKIKDRKKNL